MVKVSADSFDCRKRCARAKYEKTRGKIVWFLNITYTALKPQQRKELKKDNFFHYIYCHGKFITNLKKKKETAGIYWPPIPSIKIKKHIVVPPFPPHIRHWLSLILTHQNVCVAPFYFPPFKQPVQRPRDRHCRRSHFQSTPHPAHTCPSWPAPLQSWESWSTCTHPQNTPW